MRELEKIFILENENQFVHVFHYTVNVHNASLHVFSWPVQAQIVIISTRLCLNTFNCF